jgi:hypothetical protein
MSLVLHPLDAAWWLEMHPPPLRLGWAEYARDWRLAL